ncbi:DUF3127 domain-containing protein [Epilithonimonas sp. UC225_85]|uniref:DUF3127 domain-containing protein n=1 Tax=Epilithonimonas sp. UC225_85 TaxID=3350167 RepID=UPI0036D28E82
MKIQGEILKVQDLEVFSSGKRKQSIVIGTYESPQREFEIHFYDENIYQLEKLNMRDHVIIQFTLNSEVFEDDSGKSYFTHMIGIKILEYKRFH